MNRTTLLLCLAPLFVIACTNETGSEADDGAETPDEGPGGKGDDPLGDPPEVLPYARFDCAPNGTAEFERFGVVHELRSATVAYAYNRADLLVTAEHTEDDRIVEIRFAADDALAVVLDDAEAGALWDSDDTMFNVSSKDGTTYGDEFGLTLYEDFPMDVTCERGELPADDQLRIYVTTNMDRVAEAGKADVYEGGITVDPRSVRCAASDNVIFNGRAPVGVCQAHGDLNCPNCSSAFAIVVSRSDRDLDAMNFSVVRLASEQ